MTEHFSIAEFVASDIAKARGINNAIPADLVPQAKATLVMMERIRAELCRIDGRDVPIHISSGYRCPALNWAVRKPSAGTGTDPTGDHPRAAAVDWRAPVFGSPLQICRVLAPLVGVLGIGQLIFEKTWVHVSTRVPDKTFNRVITKLADGGFAVGIVGVA